MKYIASVFFGCVVLAAVPAHADMFCVQRQLTNLGYQPGPVDGAFGGKTAAAAQAYATDFGATLPALDKTNSGPWCEALTATAATPEGIARRFDVTSPPDPILSQAAVEKLWNMNKNIDECLIFDSVAGGRGTTFPLNVIRPDALAAVTWTSPFSTPVIGAPSCNVAPPNFGIPPAPIPRVSLDERYGERVQAVDNALMWFERASTYVRFTGDPVAREVLKRTLLEWAAKDSMGAGIRVSWGNRPIDYQMMAAILGLLTATAEVVPDLTTADKQVIGPWLNGLIKTVADSHWKDNTDNKVYLQAYMGLLWGIIVNDDVAVQSAIDVYKRAVHAMRPDGSSPIDSQRGGMGTQYSFMAGAAMVMIASTVQRQFGLDLFAYSVDGRSGHDAVDYMVRAIKDPAATNTPYAVYCPEAGDRFGAIDKPSVGFIEHSSMLLVYADLFPDDENTPWIRQRFSNEQKNAAITERVGGAPACQFAAVTDAVFSGTPVEVAGVVALPTPKLVIATREEISNQSGPNPRVSTLFSSRLQGNNNNVYSYNINGQFNILKNEFYNLRFAIHDTLPESAVEPIKACGLYFAIVRYEDERPRLEVSLKKENGQLVFPDLACVKPHLTSKVLSTVEFLQTSMQDIAIGMIKDGTVDMLGHTGLQKWMLKVAQGELVIRAAAAN